MSFLLNLTKVYDVGSNVCTERESVLRKTNRELRFNKHRSDRGVWYINMRITKTARVT